MANFKTKSKLQADAGIKLSQESQQRVLTTDANGDIKASGVSTTTLSYLDATSSIQGQLDGKASSGDLMTVAEDVQDLVALSGVPVSSTDLGAFEEEIIPDNSTIKEALQSLENAIALLPQPFFYAGTYDPSTNTPDIDDVSRRVSGALYYVTVDGTHDFGAFGGVISLNAGDKLAFNGATWDKWDHTDAVSSVFGRTGAVTAASGDYSADQITFDSTGSGIIGSDVDEALINLDSRVSDAQDDIDAHLISTSAHAAEHITLSSTKLVATDVKAGLEELADDIAAIPAAFIDSITDTASVDLTVTTGALSATVLPAGVDHDALLNYDANDHVDHSSVSIVAGEGLAGGGDITASRTLSVDINGLDALGEAPAQTDEFMVYDATATALKKVTYAEILAGVPKGSAGDIEETSFAGANDQLVLANVTGFAFSNAVVRSFTALVSVLVDADEDLYEQLTLNGIQKASGWDMAVTAVGDDSGVNFDITSAGQIQYSSPDYAGFSSMTIKFRAITTSIA